MLIGGHTNVGHHPDEISLNILFEKQAKGKLSQGSVEEDFERTRPIVLRI